MHGTIDASAQSPQSAPDKGRRKILRLLPFAVFAGIAGVVATSAFRFLRPASAQAATNNWTNVMPVADLKGDKPIMRVITVEHNSGWSSRMQEHFVYVLPQPQNRQVLTAACPHEGCNVTWRDDLKTFACPCHDSYFAPDGARLNGPARRGLDPLPSREADGILQVQFQTFDNNTSERAVRG